MVVDLDICDSKSVLIVDWQFYTFLQSAWDSNIPRTMGFPSKKCEVMLYIYKLKLYTHTHIYYKCYIGIILYIQVILFCCWVQKSSWNCRVISIKCCSWAPHITFCLGRLMLGGGCRAKFGNIIEPWDFLAMELMTPLNLPSEWSNMGCGTDCCPWNDAYY